MKHCVECGSKLITKYLEKEGDIPYCPSCKQFRFPIFNTAVSMEVIDEKTGRILLIKQYGSPSYILVAGYVNRGEAVEDTVAREVMEEIGLHVTHVSFNRSKFFEPSNTLMVNFAAYVDSDQVVKTDEVDAWGWFYPEEAKDAIRPNSLAKEFLMAWLEKEKEQMS